MPFRYWALAFASVIALASCSGGGAPEIVQTANLSASRLQFSVGTVVPPPPSEQQGTYSGPFLNLVETFRQPNGTTALLNDTVAITGPPSFVVASGNQAVANDGGAPNELLNFFQGESAFGEGFGTNVNGLAPNLGNVAPGGPPAFPRTTDGNYPPGFSYTADINTIGGSSQSFPNGFPLGTYTLNVSTPPGSGQAHTWTASANLASLTTLPAITAPQVSFDGQGGGAVTFVVPAKVSEMFVAIGAGSNQCWPFFTGTSDFTGIQTSSGLFSLFVKSPKAGSLTLAIPDNLGPPTANGNAPTFCSLAQNLKFSTGGSTTGGTASVYIVGADYPLYEMAYPQSTVQLPPIAAAVGPDGKPNPESDITISPTTIGTAP